MATKYIIDTHYIQLARAFVLKRFRVHPVLSRSQLTINYKYRMTAIEDALREMMADGTVGSAEMYIHHTVATVYYLKAEEPLIFGYFQRRQNQPRRVIA